MITQLHSEIKEQKVNHGGDPLISFSGDGTKQDDSEESEE